MLNVGYVTIVLLEFDIQRFSSSSIQHALRFTICYDFGVQSRDRCCRCSIETFDVTLLNLVMLYEKHSRGKEYIRVG